MQRAPPRRRRKKITPHVEDMLGMHLLASVERASRFLNALCKQLVMSCWGGPGESAPCQSNSERTCQWRIKRMCSRNRLRIASVPKSTPNSSIFKKKGFSLPKTSSSGWPCSLWVKNVLNLQAGSSKSRCWFRKQLQEEPAGQLLQGDLLLT